MRRIVATMICTCITFCSISCVSAKSYEITSLSLKNVTYTGRSIRNVPRVYASDGRRVSSKNYTIIYDGDTTNAGRVYVTVTGIGKYHGEAEGSYLIKRRSIKQCKVRGLKSYNESQGFIYQNLEVTYRGYDASYRLYYDYSSKVGTHVVKIKGLGNFTGTLTKKYKIYSSD